jgi:hypothetical protein
VLVLESPGFGGSGFDAHVAPLNSLCFSQTFDRGQFGRVKIQSDGRECGRFISKIESLIPASR